MTRHEYYILRAKLRAEALKQQPMIPRQGDNFVFVGFTTLDKLKLWSVQKALDAK